MRATLVLALASLSVIALLGFVRPFSARVEAQLDPGNFDLYQDGLKVGEIFVPFRDRTDQNYVEHWVLFSQYENPRENSGNTVISPAGQRYESAQDFFQRVPFGPGSRYVRIRANESLNLPAR